MCPLFLLHFPSFHSLQQLSSYVSTWRESESMAPDMLSSPGPSCQSHQSRTMLLSARHLTCRCCSAVLQSLAAYSADQGDTMAPRLAPLVTRETPWLPAGSARDQDVTMERSWDPVSRGTIVSALTPVNRPARSQSLSLTSRAIFQHSNEQIYFECKVGVK